MRQKGNPAEALAEGIAGIPNVEIIVRGSYSRIVANGVTLGYVPKGRTRVDVPSGEGNYVTYTVATKADVRKVVSAMKRVARHGK
jgi:hypothetical protein